MGPLLVALLPLLLVALLPLLLVALLPPVLEVLLVPPMLEVLFEPPLVPPLVPVVTPERGVKLVVLLMSLEEKPVNTPIVLVPMTQSWRTMSQ